MQKIKHSKRGPLKSKDRINANDDISIAALALDPACNSATVIKAYSRSFGEQSVGDLARELLSQNERMHEGKLNRVESMLIDQAHSLQAIFTNFSHRAINSEFMPMLEQYMRLALKAQAQCARTLEVLVGLKNPHPLAIVEQTNIGQAVQVNNAGAPLSRSDSAGEGLKKANELLEVVDGKRMDSSSPAEASSAYSHLEPV